MAPLKTTRRLTGQVHIWRHRIYFGVGFRGRRFFFNARRWRYPKGKIDYTKAPRLAFRHQTSTWV